MISSISSVKPISYKSDTDDASKIELQNETSKEIERIKRNDMYSKMPLRILGYTNEFGEAIRPISPVLANLSWLPAIGYISADIADKYKQNEYAEKTPSKRRAFKQFSTQLFASVILPTFAVKLGQGIANAGGVLTSKRLTLNDREKVSDLVIDAMNSGEHMDHLSYDGKIDDKSFENAIFKKINERLKHRSTHKKQNPLSKIVNFMLNPFDRMNPHNENVKDYTGTAIRRIAENRRALLTGNKPKLMTEKTFKRIQKSMKGVSTEEKQSIVYDAIRKLEKKQLMKNKMIKTIGGFTALACLAQPIDNFVENTIIDKYIGPQIDNVTEMYIKHRNVQKII